LNFKVKEYFSNIIIGHTGYIGSFLLQEIIKNEENVLGISRQKMISNNAVKNKRLSEIKSDIFREKIFDKLEQNFKPTIYICAHNVQNNFLHQRKNLPFIYKNNKIFYKNFIDNIKSLKPEKLIFLSTGGSLYENSNILEPSVEDSILNPKSEYGLSKYILENFLINFSENYQIPLIICRLSTIYGSSYSEKKFGFINYLKQCSSKNIRPVIFGKNTYRDYLHIKDLIAILLKITKQKLLSNTYNISYGKSYSCEEIYYKVKQNLNKDGLELREFKDQGVRLGENKKIFISSDKLKKEMNWKPNININQGIRDTLSE